MSSINGVLTKPTNYNCTSNQIMGNNMSNYHSRLSTCLPHQWGGWGRPHKVCWPLGHTVPKPHNNNNTQPRLGRLVARHMLGSHKVVSGWLGHTLATHRRQAQACSLHCLAGWAGLGCLSGTCLTGTTGLNCLGPPVLHPVLSVGVVTLGGRLCPPSPSPPVLPL